MTSAPLYPAYLPTRPEGHSASVPHPSFDAVEPGTRAEPSKPNLFAHKELRHKNLTPRIGTEIRGIQLTALNEKELDEVALLAAERGVLVFRDQDFKDAGFEKQRELARHFGPLHRHASMGYPAGTSPEFHVIYADEQVYVYAAHKTQVIDGRTNSYLTQWEHQGSSRTTHKLRSLARRTWEIHTPSTTFFWVLEIPGSGGGDTAFSSLTHAYQALSPAFRKTLEGLTLRHSSASIGEIKRMGYEKATATAAVTEHPLVIKHPAREPTLYVSPTIAREVVGFKPEESDNLLNFLHQHIRSLDFQCRASWEPGTVVVWDQRTTAHTAIPDYADGERRHMIRISPLGAKPQPTPKIQRPANMQAYERSTELWFEDGTLIVLAGRVSFRVYRGIVAQNSPIFEDMLSIPQPVDVELYEGCPVVELLDAPEDVLPFLKALHSVGDARYFDVSQPIQWSVLSGILRLSTKYQVDFLRQRTYEVLHRLYPTTLEEWDARDAYVNLETFEARPFAVYLLAKETNLPTLLPAALYLCADSQDINFILDGLDSFDRRHIELDWPDKKACIRARETLSIALRTRLFAFLTGQMDFPGCHRTSVCNNTRWKWLQGVEASLGSGVFSVSFPWAQYQNGVCDNCHRLSREHYAAERQKLWNELPVLFGLPPWDELRRAVDVGSRTL
ncbi:hypothetical protein VNI00_000328 [Paramarasmius palmivorus]|uniref:TauD/TfdA-like domain-containing protein n=1 Tax=Paramarasmius palmivorus TaxID=297713 RepID=A0AAW0ECA0_9AGAR